MPVLILSLLIVKINQKLKIFGRKLMKKKNEEKRTGLSLSSCWSGRTWDSLAACCECHYDGSFPAPDGKDLCSFSLQQKTAPEDQEDREENRRMRTDTMSFCCHDTRSGCKSKGWCDLLLTLSLLVCCFVMMPRIPSILKLTSGVSRHYRLFRIFNCV